MIRLVLLITIFKIIFSFYIANENKHNISAINNFVFGSCYNGVDHHKSRYDIFDIIENNKPDLFIWTGDAAYVRYYYKKPSFIDKIFNSLFNRYESFNSTHVEFKFNQTKNNICILIIKYI